MNTTQGSEENMTDPSNYPPDTVGGRYQRPDHGLPGRVDVIARGGDRYYVMVESYGAYLDRMRITHRIRAASQEEFMSKLGRLIMVNVDEPVATLEW